MGIEVRRAAERGYCYYDWLKAYHTFSFGDYQDPKYNGFRCLKALNDNRVKNAVGFPLHDITDMEILSIPLEGGLAHQDDMANGAILRPGYVQLLSTGTGVVYSETNASDKEYLHFLEAWLLPNVKNAEPGYQEAFFPNEAKQNRWCVIASPDGRENSLKINQDAFIYLSNLDEGQELNFTLSSERYGWLQVLSGEIELNKEIVLNAGDGASLAKLPSFVIRARLASYLLYFDLP